MNIFSRVPIARPKRNVFNLSHERKFSCNMGKLIPIFVEDLVPGDVFRNSSEIFMRFAPMLAPVMHRVNVYTHFFFVPNRLVMPKWSDFITGNDSTVTLPAFDLMMFTDAKYNDLMLDGSLADYMGLPTRRTGSTFLVNHLSYQCLPFLAYQLIYNEYYRDQDLQEPVDIDYENFDSGNAKDKYAEIMTLRTRSWEKDYFTSAAPWAQKGDPVLIPGTGSRGRYAPVIYDAVRDEGPAPGDGHTIVSNRGTNQTPYEPSGFDINTGQVTSGSDFGVHSNFIGKFPGFQQRLGVTVRDTSDPMFDRYKLGVSDIDPNGNLWADIGAATDDKSSRSLSDWPPSDKRKFDGATINDLRTAFQIQKWLERNARAGSRYIEQILSHFGVRTPDSRLQRPEYLGGGKSPVVISEVLQTSETNETAQGNMAGHGVSAGVTNRFKYEALEHGYIIGIMSVMPRTAYQQGIPRHFLRQDKFDFFWPTLAHLGEQPIYNQELYHNFDVGSSENSGVFGYQSRYSEYRYIPSTVHGDFRGKNSFWHLGRMFSELPKLNEEFIKCNPSTRIFAVEDESEQKLWVQLYNNCHAVRPMPRYAEPGLVDHF